MADVYVKVEKFSSQDFKEVPKLKKDAPDAMVAAAGDVVTSTKGFTSKVPKGDDAKGYAIGGVLTKFAKTTDGKFDTLKCSIDMVLSEWPTPLMKTQKFVANAKLTTETTTKERDQLSDAVACAAAAAKDGTEKALKAIKELQK